MRYARLQHRPVFRRKKNRKCHSNFKSFMNSIQKMMMKNI